MARTNRNLPKAKSYGKKYLKNPSSTRHYLAQVWLIDETQEMAGLNLSKLNRIKNQSSNRPNCYNDKAISAVSEVWTKDEK